MLHVFREAGLHQGTAKISGHKMNHSELRQKQMTTNSGENYPTDSVPDHSTAASADGDLTQLSSRAMNAKNALMQIESKVKETTSKSICRDPAQDARTVFVGNVALTVNKKVS